MDLHQLLDRIGRRWQEFNETFDGLDDVELLEPGVTGEWSIKDILAHVASWDGEALKALPIIMAGKRPPRYGGVDRFNEAQSTINKRLSLAEARTRLRENHAGLVTFLGKVPASFFATETRFRHRLRLDTWGHYPEHTRAILEWRDKRS